MTRKSGSDPYAEGRDAHARADDVNPYIFGGTPEEIAEWQRGWSDAHRAALAPNSDEKQT